MEGWLQSILCIHFITCCIVIGVMADAQAVTGICLIAATFILNQLSTHRSLSDGYREFFNRIVQLITAQFSKIHLILHCRQHMGLPKGVKC